MHSSSNHSLRLILAAGAVVLALALLGAPAVAELTFADPPDAAISGLMPGAVLAVGRSDSPVGRRLIGYAAAAITMSGLLWM